MFIKAYRGDGEWSIHDGKDVSFLGDHSQIEVPDGDHHYPSDDRFPQNIDVRFVLHTTEPLGEQSDRGPYRLMRWVSWHDLRGTRVQVITDGPVFICNDRGDTVEALR